MDFKRMDKLFKDRENNLLLTFLHKAVDLICEHIERRRLGARLMYSILTVNNNFQLKENAMRNRMNAGARSNFQNQILDSLGSIQGKIDKGFNGSNITQNQKHDSLFSMLSRIELKIETSHNRLQRMIAVLGLVVGLLAVNAGLMWLLR